MDGNRRQVLRGGNSGNGGAGHRTTPGVPCSEVFEAGGELVTDELWEAFSEFKEEFLAGFILVGEHVEIEPSERFDVLVLQERSRGDGNRFATG